MHGCALCTRVTELAGAGATSRRGHDLLALLHVLLDPLEQQPSDVVAVGVPHHDVVVAPDAGLRNAIVERGARQLRQREIDRVATGPVDLVVSVEAWSGLRPTDLVDAVDAE